MFAFVSRPFGNTDRSRSSSGFTLLELLLVVAVLAAIASLTLPQIAWLLGDRRVVRAADQVREELMMARIDAMRNGRIMMLDGEIDSNQLRIRPYFSMADSVNAIDQTGSQSGLLSGADQGMLTTVMDDESQTKMIDLPEEISVANIAVVSAARAAEITQANLSNEASGFSSPILFYPDGTTSTAAVVVSDPKYGKITVKLRGITGDVTIGELEPSS